MKKLLFFLLITSQLYAQKINFSGKLVDKETKEPVVYANISFLDSNKGISSNEDGSFNLLIDQKYLDSKIHISCLNYKDTIISAKEVYKKTFFLESTAEVLDEIVLTKIVEKLIVLGEVKKDVQGIHTSGMRMLAKYFPNDKRTKCCSYLSELEIHFSERANQRRKSKFRIRVFSQDEKTGLPKDDLLNVNLPVAIEKEDLKAVIDISTYNIKMPENGLFIAFEKLFIPYNEYGQNTNEEENDVFYSPMIGFAKYKKKDRNDAFYTFVKGKWLASPLYKIKYFIKYAPAISLKLTN